MTINEAMKIIKNFQELALEYAKRGEIDTVANINLSLADFVERHKDILTEK